MPPWKRLGFLLESLNALGTSYFFNYLFFYLREEFGFRNADNFKVTAVHGLTYLLLTWWAGRFARRRGAFVALRLGFAIMAGAMVAGGLLAHLAWAQFVVVVIWTAGMSFTWPTLEALASEGESPVRLPQTIGLYNVVWAASAGLAYFTGGAIVEHLGWRTIYWIPAGILLLQFVLTSWLQRLKERPVAGGTSSGPGNAYVPPLNPRPIAKARTFLKLAWLANPLAYVAINSLLPVIPKVADQLGLTPMYAGFFCSVWFFARLAAFVLLWVWPGWHYRLGWLLGAYVVMIASYLAILLVPQLAVVVGAQVAFGVAVGLIYYSSLFYSMDVGEAKADHGGLHEAAIGVGIFAGPAIGLGSLYVFPAINNVGILAVSVALSGGLLALPWVYRTGMRKRQGGATQ